MSGLYHFVLLTHKHTKRKFQEKVKLRIDNW